MKDHQKQPISKAQEEHPVTDQKEVELSEKLFHRTYGQLGKPEKHVAHHLVARTHIAENIVQDYAAQLTFGQRLADNVASFGGSWTFISIFAVVLVFWVMLNSLVLIRYDEVFDPYPYILLNLFLSMLAAIQAPIILMSQNRQAYKDRLSAEHDYEVNLKSELEIMTLHDKIDLLREKQWSELISLQQEQLRLLTQVVKDLKKEKELLPDRSSRRDRTTLRADPGSAAGDVVNNQKGGFPMRVRYAALIALLMVANLTANAFAETPCPGIHVKILDIKNSIGSVACALFESPEGFPSEFLHKATNVMIIRIKKSQARCDFEDIPPGTYAMVVIHDENMNGKLDTNALGIPKEGYGFSKDAKKFLGTPTFSDASFKYDGENVDMTMTLHY